MAYTRKYYLIRKLKAEGFDLLKSRNERVIIVPLNKLKDAEHSRTITELMKQHQYGVQLVSSIEEPQKLMQVHELVAAASKIVNEKLSLFKRFRMMMKQLNNSKLWYNY
jgi:hypothetical protein